ncbi:hypothetical protein C0Q70_11890 [Pomacea canaliculata]|uniref:G-protein coupled receptors family 1 profile domain-containing protein n=1 Tax=Pomacea canaliculata TaxID=400727 RepID=A0A2T7P7C3_POMCA|nr:hypothetical protein C0Q70_11890 [Pomacea canaliculata]
MANKFGNCVKISCLYVPGLPPELYAIWEAYPWRLGETFCYLRQTILELTSYASVLTITAFTVERYLAICKYVCDVTVREGAGEGRRVLVREEGPGEGGGCW